jgi:hypothetical protein
LKQADLARERRPAGPFLFSIRCRVFSRSLFSAPHPVPLSRTGAPPAGLPFSAIFSLKLPNFEYKHDSFKIVGGTGKGRGPGAGRFSHLNQSVGSAYEKS